MDNRNNLYLILWLIGSVFCFMAVSLGITFFSNKELIALFSLGIFLLGIYIIKLKKLKDLSISHVLFSNSIGKIEKDNFSGDKKWILGIIFLISILFTVIDYLSFKKNFFSLSLIGISVIGIYSARVKSFIPTLAYMVGFVISILLLNYFLNYN